MPFEAEVLRQVAETVPPDRTDLDRLITAMTDVMRAHRGVGLAAPQVGVSIRLFVYECPDAAGTVRLGHVVNPVMVPRSGRERLVEHVEGCLSLPGLHAPLARADHAVVRGVDVSGAPVEIEGDGLLARCLQHEIDHLDGRLFISRLSSRERRRLLAEPPG